MTPAEACLIKFLEVNKSTLWPGKGKQQAALIRETCDVLGLNEDDYLDNFMVREKQKWGLTPRPEKHSITKV